MKVMTILGTRPEIIRLSRIIDKLDGICDHVLVHTGQNFDTRLSDLFFDQLRIRRPDYYMGIRANSTGEQIALILSESEKVLEREKPDRLLLLGDTNSALSAIVAKRMNIPVYHMEAGNRCYDDRVPEEVNRRIIDHCSDVLMPYTERSRQNLIREGIEGERIYVIGNPINEVITYYDAEIQKSQIMSDIGVEPGKYFLVTMHRAENVDIPDRLLNLTKALDQLQKEYSVPVIVSTHPHTRIRMEMSGIKSDNGLVRFMRPFGFFEFIKLERHAMCVISDSGTVQEECALFGVPNVTIRDVTERPETLECGSNILTGADVNHILRCVKMVIERIPSWRPPKEYLVENVSDIAINVLFSYRTRVY